MTKQDCRYMFADNLKDLLKECNMNQQELAEEIGISCSMVSQYISGDKMPSVYVLHNIADVLGCTFDDLLGYADRIDI